MTRSARTTRADEANNVLGVEDVDAASVRGDVTQGQRPDNDSQDTGSSPAAACRWKDCKKVDKQCDGAVLRACSMTECDRVVHAACSSSMLEMYGATSAFKYRGCSKRCYNALIKQTITPVMQVKKRVLWHNDGPTAGISSIGVLIDWLTTGTNYNRYRGAEGQNRESKTTQASEISRLISEASITTNRSVKDITNKISSLETTFRTAEEWFPPVVLKLGSFSTRRTSRKKSGRCSR
ncbi:unnamed protein product [Phytophthora fragariaefolia]|uniref:Unnamed protein product n=1 Tax=Phytophthora fragariaefolia TaxID=1490495 RepID=A0A9W6WYZ5_9STRA|nr:unnamed protein product [Phytophthora fragariaefolia]